MKKLTTEREDTGVILYGIQQSLAQMQMELEKYDSRCSLAAAKRRKVEEDLACVKNLYQMQQAKTNSERSKGKLNDLLNYLLQLVIWNKTLIEVNKLLMNETQQLK